MAFDHESFAWSIPGIVHFIPKSRNSVANPVPNGCCHIKYPSLAMSAGVLQPPVVGQVYAGSPQFRDPSSLVTHGWQLNWLTHRTTVGVGESDGARNLTVAAGKQQAGSNSPGGELQAVSPHSPPLRFLWGLVVSFVHRHVSTNGMDPRRVRMGAGKFADDDKLLIVQRGHPTEGFTPHKRPWTLRIVGRSCAPGFVAGAGIADIGRGN